MTEPISRKELEICDEKEKNEKMVALASLIDQRIYKSYKLFKTNYIAYDILNGGNTFADHYSADEKKDFIAYMNDGLAHIGIEAETSELEQIFLRIYANPVVNC